MFSGAKRLAREEAKIGAFIPLSFINCKTFSFQCSKALLLLIEASVIALVNFSAVFLIVAVSGSKTFFIFSWKFCLPCLSCEQNAASWFF